MPEAAIDTAVVDQVLALDNIGAALADLVARQTDTRPKVRCGILVSQ